MKVEIKEILDWLKDYKIDRPFGISIYDRKILSDYITNLQESEAYYYGQYKDYKSRCEKALDKLYCYGEVFDSKILQQFQKEMLNILEGSDKE